MTGTHWCQSRRKSKRRLARGQVLCTSTVLRGPWTQEGKRQEQRTYAIPSLETDNTHVWSRNDCSIGGSSGSVSSQVSCSETARGHINSSRGDTSASELQKLGPGGSPTALGKASRLGSIGPRERSRFAMSTSLLG